MDPNMMSSMMNMMNNPEMMSQMKGMMDNPQMQDMLSNPDLMKNVMGMFGGDKEDDTSADTSATLEPVEPVDPVDTHKYTDSDLIVINNLTAEEYNGMCVKVISFNEVKQRYVVEIEDGKQLLVKEENLFLKNDLIEVN